VGLFRGKSQSDIGLWARIGATGFGGPAGQISIMHREVVQQRGWLDEDQFAHALSFCMLLPGPEAHQLATYIGWRRHGLRGALTSSALFVIPGAALMLALSWMYVLYGNVTWVSGLLSGLQAAVIAIVVQALVRMGKRQLSSPAMFVIAGISFLGLVLFAIPFPAIIIVAGVGGWLTTLVRRHDTETAATTTTLMRPANSRKTLVAASIGISVWIVSVVAVCIFAGGTVFPDIGLLFSKTAIITFGGAYAVLGYIAQQAVMSYGWLSASQMTVGLGLAETTPGPLILVLEFVGFVAAYEHPGGLPPLLAGTLGALLTLWVLFLPSTCFVLLGAPFLERLRRNVPLRGALRAIGASVVGVVASLGLWLSINTLFSNVGIWTWGPLRVMAPHLDSIHWSTLVIAILGFVITFVLKWSMLRTLGICALLGLISALALPGV
jgi:chromate transporter